MKITTSTTAAAATILLCQYVPLNAFVPTATSTSMSFGKKSKTLKMLPDMNALLSSSDLSIADLMSSSGFSSMLTSVSDAVVDVGAPTYSKASYYTTLGLYLMSFPGIWSTVKRSTKAKTKRYVFMLCIYYI